MSIQLRQIEILIQGRVDIAEAEGIAHDVTLDEIRTVLYSTEV